jgi:NADPH-dependent curcumin reductase CurA
MEIYHKKPQDMYGVKNLWLLPNKSIRMEGFICDMTEERSQALVNKVAPLLVSKQFKVLQDTTMGIENAPQGLAGVFAGNNFGKSVLQIAGINE